MANDLSAYEEMPYRKFMARAEMQKILNTLSGILKGINLDLEITGSEIDELRHWCNYYRKYKDWHPFNELIQLIDASIEDNILSPEELKDIKWLLSSIQYRSKDYYEKISASMQVLHGILHGILADNTISDDEIDKLMLWINDHEYLKGTYPYDEVDSLLISILEDGLVTEEERNTLKAFFGEFIDTTLSFNLNQAELDELKEKYNVKGICASCPEITFKDSVFCFTGASIRTTRQNLKAIIERLGGKYSDTVTKQIDYLIVGADGNPCWVFACYGRKVEKAIDMRKGGHRITIVHENDFWDALQDTGMGAER